MLAKVRSRPVSAAPGPHTARRGGPRAGRAGEGTAVPGPTPAFIALLQLQA